MLTGSSSIPSWSAFTLHLPESPFPPPLLYEEQIFYIFLAIWGFSTCPDFRGSTVQPNLISECPPGIQLGHSLFSKGRLELRWGKGAGPWLACPLTSPSLSRSDTDAPSRVVPGVQLLCLCLTGILLPPSLKPTENSCCPSSAPGFRC